MTREAQASELLRELLAPHGATAAGVTFGSAGSWALETLRLVPIAEGKTLRMTHDEREAPVALADDGSWNDDCLVSLTDEHELAACAWARVVRGSDAVGLGVDIASREDFAGKRGEQFNPLLFTPAEHELVPALAPGDPALGYAFAFSAKEAAFKACAAPLRRWYWTHDEELLFDVRCFELADATHEAGTARRGEAARAMELLGIQSIELARMALGDKVLTLALAIQSRR